METLMHIYYCFLAAAQVTPRFCAVSGKDFWSYIFHYFSLCMRTGNVSNCSNLNIHNLQSKLPGKIGQIQFLFTPMVCFGIPIPLLIILKAVVGWFHVISVPLSPLFSGEESLPLYSANGWWLGLVRPGMRKGTASWLARLRHQRGVSFCRGLISQHLNPTWRGLNHGLLVKRGLDIVISEVVKYFQTLLATTIHRTTSWVVCCACYRRYVASCDLAACRCELPPKFCAFEKTGHVWCQDLVISSPLPGFERLWCKVQQAMIQQTPFYRMAMDNFRRDGQPTPRWLVQDLECHCDL